MSRVGGGESGKRGIESGRAKTPVTGTDLFPLHEGLPLLDQLDAFISWYTKYYCLVGCSAFRVWHRRPSLHPLQPPPTELRNATRPEKGTSNEFQ